MRLDVLEFVFDPIRRFLNDPSEFMAANCRGHIEATGPGTRRTTIIEALQMRLMDADIWPLQPEEYVHSISDLTFQLNKIGLELEVMASNFYRQILRIIRARLAEPIEVFLKRSHRVELWEKRGLSGVESSIDFRFNSDDESIADSSAGVDSESDYGSDSIIPDG